MYKAIYKCRMCGETFAEEFVETHETAKFAALAVATGGRVTPVIGYEVAEKTAHDCPDGSIGYADFVGFRKGKDDEPKGM